MVVLFFDGDDDAGGPVLFGEGEIGMVFKVDNELCCFFGMAFGPIGLGQHVVNHINTAGVE